MPGKSQYTNQSTNKIKQGENNGIRKNRTPRKLRIKTANEWNKKTSEGWHCQTYHTMQFATEDANELDAIAQELGLSRPQAIKNFVKCIERVTNNKKNRTQKVRQSLFF